MKKKTPTGYFNHDTHVREILVMCKSCSVMWAQDFPIEIDMSCTETPVYDFCSNCIEENKTP